MKLTLISHALCPYVQRAVIAMMEKGAAYERIDIDLANKPAWFLSISPLGKTPVLLVDGQPIFESAVICEYLEETLGSPLHPAAPLERARHRAWIEFGSGLLAVLGGFYSARDTPACEAGAATLKERIAKLESALGEGPYFDGARFSLVDAAFAPLFRYFDVFDEFGRVDLFEAAPKVRAWHRALKDRPSVRDAVDQAYAHNLVRFVINKGGVLGARMARKAGQH